MVPALAGFWYLLPAREPDAVRDWATVGLSSPDFASNLNPTAVFAERRAALAHELSIAPDIRESKTYGSS